MTLPPFKLERYFARYEFNTEYLLCSSDCEAMSIADLLALEPGSAEKFQGTWLGYTESQGHPALRKEIANIYETIQPEEILVHTGAEEAIYLFMHAVLNPENGGLVMGPTMDHQIIRALFRATAEAARALKVDSALADRLDLLRGEIAPNRVGRLGQLQEWLEDKDDPENKHRHVSHLWGVFPGEEITKRTPELFEAAKKSLLFRGDDGTGWSLGWKIAFWARFLDGDHALRMIERQLTAVKDEGTRMSGGGTYPNLFDAHPPFQIDGNFALTAGVAEMLVQSHDGVVSLLPALPEAWRDGSVKGLRARGGLELDLRWRDGRLVEAGVVSSGGERVRISYRDETAELALRRGHRVVWRPL
jgi:alpha-L-fucosidase 2